MGQALAKETDTVLNHFDNLGVVKSVKKKSFAEAQRLGIPLFDSSGARAGTLVPIGEWIVRDTEKIKLLTLWRKQNNSSFLTQFEPTFKGTRDYLIGQALEKRTQVLFGLFGASEEFLGHLGLREVSGSSAELDNFVRGTKGGHPSLVQIAEVALLHWAFEELKILTCTARVMSYNWPALALHRRIGFIERSEVWLRREDVGGKTVHFETEKELSNVSYWLKEIVINRSEFFSLHSDKLTDSRGPH